MSLLQNLGWRKVKGNPKMAQHGIAQVTRTWKLMCCTQQIVGGASGTRLTEMKTSSQWLTGQN